MDGEWPNRMKGIIKPSKPIISKAQAAEIKG